MTYIDFAKAFDSVCHTNCYRNFMAIVLLVIYIVGLSHSLLIVLSVHA